MTLLFKFFLNSCSQQCTTSGDAGVDADGPVRIRALGREGGNSGDVAAGGGEVVDPRGEEPSERRGPRPL